MTTSKSGSSSIVEPNRHSESENQTAPEEEIPRTMTTIMKKYLSPKVQPFIPQPLPPPIPPPPPPPPPALVVQPSPPDAQGTSPPVPPPPRSKPYEMRVTRMGSLQFKQKVTSSAIEVLLEEPRITVRNRQKDRTSIVPVTPDPSPLKAEPIMKPNPKKIRIRSNELLHLLEVIGRKRGYNHTLMRFDSTEPMVFYHPFKLFAGMEPDIRDKFAELEAEIKITEAEVKKEEMIENVGQQLTQEIEEKAIEKSKKDLVQTQDEESTGKSTDETTGKQILDEIGGEIGALIEEGKVKAIEKEKDGAHGMAVPDDKTTTHTQKQCPNCGHKLERSSIEGHERTTVDAHDHEITSAFAEKKKEVELLKLLVEILDVDLKPMFDLRRDIKDRVLTQIAFQDLWHLYEIGQSVMTGDAEPQVYRVIRWTGGRPDFQSRALNFSNARSEPRSSTFIIDCVYTDFNGSLYTPVQQTFAIRKYDGERAILNLSVFPLEFDPDHNIIRQELVARGRKWLQLARADYWVHKSYKGQTLAETPEEVDSQVIVDMKAGMIAFTQNQLQIGGLNLTSHDRGETQFEDPGPADVTESDHVHQDYDLDQKLESIFLSEHQPWLVATVEPEDIKDEDKILLPQRVYGFVLRIRHWVRLDVNKIEEVTYTSGFDDLVLPDGHKETVRALVANHARGPIHPEATHSEHGVDLVRGKGEGLVILLHGAPGVGKTSSAECVADSTKRPLYPITCGDIGDTAAEVQTNLNINFQFAHKWGCVLLLDEADIFLQKRDKQNITRNSIVSVFLRTLEYYSGILILTTNRVGTFDPAFRSRIHVSLYYPSLKKDATMQIWKMHLNRVIELKGKEMKINSKEILKFAKEHYHELKKEGAGTWNGRQIRNAFQTAIALAEFRGREREQNGNSNNHRIELGREQFNTVVQASRDFDMYLKRTLGGQTEADQAENEQWRNDSYQDRRESHTRRGKVISRKKGRREDDSEESEDDSEASEDSSFGRQESSENESESEEEKSPPPPPRKSRKKQR